MKLELAQVVSAWPFGVSLAAALAAQAVQAGRRRSVLNEAVHELRRPLQALALVPAAGSGGETAIAGSVQMAATALERLEREINGEPTVPSRAPIAARPLLAAAVGRWRARAALAGGSLSLRWQAGEATVEGDRCELAQAVDNLVVNAIEHGGPEIAVAADVHRGRLRIAVTDSGRASRPAARRESPAESIARLLGRSRRGHGLRVVRRAAAAHGGDFHLRRSERGTVAVLELPLSGGAG
ncbi:MAG TPA: HAMP domain-containing sensor histidine kinase [Solirubrobacterales bacterium]|nr:HAMP domain-containing sensor histidine kinase [Solirubrobacterales bacterium]